MNNAFLGILVGWLSMGILDGLSAVILYKMRGLTLTRGFQGIAAGLLGKSAFDGGGKTALLGVAMHFCVALGVAAVYYAASRQIAFLLNRPVISGVIYGAIVFFVMFCIVLPLSALPGYKFTAIPMDRVLVQLAIHMVIVGPTVAIAIARLTTNRAS
jgi:hypothetical protein